MSKVLQWVNRNVWSTKFVVAFAHEATKTVDRSRKSEGIANTYALPRKWMATANHSRNKAMDRRKMIEQAKFEYGAVCMEMEKCVPRLIKEKQKKKKRQQQQQQQ